MLKLRKDFSTDSEIQGTTRIIWYEFEADGVTVKSFIKTSGRSKVVPPSSVQLHKRPFKKIKSVLARPS